jgi:hypothetical protein
MQAITGAPTLNKSTGFLSGSSVGTSGLRFTRARKSNGNARFNVVSCEDIQHTARLVSYSMNKIRDI